MKVSWTDLKSFIEEDLTVWRFIEFDNDYYIAAKDDWFDMFTYLKKTDPKSADQIEFEDNYKYLAINKLTDKSGARRVATDKSVDDFDTLITENMASLNNTVDTVADFEIKPPSGEFIAINRAEAQWENDLKIDGETTFHLDYYVWIPDGQGGYIEYNAVTKSFASKRDLFALGNQHSTYSGGINEMQNGLTTLHFNYPSKLKLFGDPKALELSKLICRLENNKPAHGSYVTIGFVTTSGEL